MHLTPVVIIWHTTLSLCNTEKTLMKLFLKCFVAQVKFEAFTNIIISCIFYDVYFLNKTIFWKRLVYSLHYRIYRNQHMWFIMLSVFLVILKLWLLMWFSCLHGTYIIWIWPNSKYMKNNRNILVHINPVNVSHCFLFLYSEVHGTNWFP